MIPAHLQYAESLAADLEKANQPFSAMVLRQVLEERAELLAALEGLASNEIVNAFETIEYGPGGTSAEAAAIELIQERRDTAKTAIAKAKG